MNPVGHFLRPLLSIGEKSSWKTKHWYARTAVRNLSLLLANRNSTRKKDSTMSQRDARLAETREKHKEDSQKKTLLNKFILETKEANKPLFLLLFSLRRIDFSR